MRAPLKTQPVPSSTFVNFEAKMADCYSKRSISVILTEIDYKHSAANTKAAHKCVSHWATFLAARSEGSGLNNLTVHKELFNIFALFTRN